MSIDLVMDLGSENVKIYKCGEGLVFNEPAIALVDRTADKLLLGETGYKAKKIAAETLERYTPVHPIKNAVITDQEVAELMLCDFLEKINVRPTMKERLRIIALTACGLTFSDRKVFAGILKNIGASRVYIVDGLFALYSYSEVSRGFFVDVGGAVANVAYITEGGIVSGCHANIAGNAMNEEICNMVHSKYALSIGGRAAERLKLSSGGLEPNIKQKFPVSGKDIVTGELRSAEIAGSDIRSCIVVTLDKLVLLINSMLFSLPEKDYNFICKNGIFLSGGTARLLALPEYLAERLKLKICVVKDCEEAAVTGAARFYEEKGLLSDFTV
ncbi:MAG: rod shape-determining protein [Clostridiales bacterium]|jgi:rod shape-determining protein MreB|nr:rod shape-determining protein [Clostridiales bacterium]